MPIERKIAPKIVQVVLKSVKLTPTRFGTWL